jgi:rhamnogalacturonyl hydrolase YesR
LDTRSYGLHYSEVATAYGALRFAAAIRDKQLVDQLVARYQGMLVAGAPGTAPASQPGGRGNSFAVAPKDGTGARIIPAADHVDHSVFGALPLEIYRQTRDRRYLEIGKKSADTQWADPTPDGLTSQTRFWIDDMFMIIALQMQAYRASGEKIYLDRAALEMVAYLDRLQQPNGLFFHSPTAHFYWGRGDGWVAAGLTEILLDLPADHPHRARIVDGYRKMMAGLLKHQAPDGMWRQLIDNEQSWPESSCTGMFTFAMASGVKRGWLDPAQFKEPARKSWIALCGYVNEDGQVREVCDDTGANTSVQYYQNRPRIVGRLHGQAAVLWAAWGALD